MTKPKRNYVRREKNVGEFRAELSSIANPGKTRDQDLDYELDGLDRIIRQKSNALEQKVAASIKIQKMKQAGLSTEDIEQAKVDFGLTSKGAIQSQNSESAYNVISMELAKEQDPGRRSELIKALMTAETLQKGGASKTEIMNLINNLGQSTTTPKKETFESKMMEKLADHLFKEPKSELDNLDKLTGLIEKVQKLTPQNDTMKEMKENVALYKELGIISDRKDTLQEMQLEIEKHKADKQYEIRKEEIAADRERTDKIGSIAGDAISSTFAAIGATSGKGNKQTQIPKEKYVRDTLEAVCVSPGCGAKILVTNSAQTRNITCPKCGSNYQYDANQKKLFLLGEESSGPPVREPPGQQSPPPQRPGPGITDHPIV